VNAPGAPDRRRRTLWLLVALAVGMFGFGFAMVPLYGLLCDATDLQSVRRMEAVDADAGKTRTAEGSSRWVTVKFDTTVHPDLPWSLDPTETKVRVRLGEPRLVNFVAENRTGGAVTGQAIPAINPWKASVFFSKIECFCFTRQTLEGGERKVMPVRFVVSPDLPPDVDSITLSYSVMRVLEPGTKTAAN
jgi:cytochrome c oxidase assembly protein subunit 11